MNIDKESNLGKRKSENIHEDEPYEKFRNLNYDDEIQEEKETIHNMSMINEEQIKRIKELNKIQQENLNRQSQQSLINEYEKIAKEIKNNEEFINNRLKNWHKRQKVFIQFKKYKNVCDTLNNEYRYLINKMKIAHSEWMSDYMSEMARLRYQEDEERFEIKYNEKMKKREEERKEKEFYDSLKDVLPAEKINKIIKQEKIKRGKQQKMNILLHKLNTEMRL